MYSNTPKDLGRLIAKGRKGLESKSACCTDWDTST